MAVEGLDDSVVALAPSPTVDEAAAPDHLEQHRRPDLTVAAAVALGDVERSSGVGWVAGRPRIAPQQVVDETDDQRRHAAAKHTAPRTPKVAMRAAPKRESAGPVGTLATGEVGLPILLESKLALMVLAGIGGVAGVPPPAGRRLSPTGAPGES